MRRQVAVKRASAHSARPVLSFKKTSALCVPFRGKSIMSVAFTSIAGHKVVSRGTWLEARKALLAREKEFTHARDALNAERRKLPLVKVDKDYCFETPAGKVSLLGLFEGRRQLIVYHFMFHRDRGVGCPGCSHMADNIPQLA